MASHEVNLSGHESLPHEQNRAIIGFTKSPQGMDVIGMTVNGKEWILLATMQAITADRVRVQLKEELDIDSLPGIPFDWRASLQKKELILVEGLKQVRKPLRSGSNSMGIEVNNPVGVYIPAEKFDDAPKPHAF